MTVVDIGIICTAVITVLSCLGYMTALIRGRTEEANQFCGVVAASFAVTGLFDMLNREWAAAAIEFACAVIWFQRWRRGRRRRKRSLKALGHKARARLEQMIRNMPRPGPVLRPVPQGAS